MIRCMPLELTPLSMALSSQDASATFDEPHYFKYYFSVAGVCLL